MNESEGIIGADKLVAVFGYWPSFHDAEMLWLKLDRQPREGFYGPTLEAAVHAFEITSDVGEDGCYVLRHHVLVHLRFDEVDELRIDGFNHQNALFGISITDVRQRQMERVKWEVRFTGSFGVEASFQCYSVEVVSVACCDKSGVPV